MRQLRAALHNREQGRPGKEGESLDDALLDSLSAGLAAVRAVGIKVTMRFVYNDGFDPDAPKARVLEHIQQVKPLLAANADVIAAFQAGFIGAWGEWHSSTNGLATPQNRKDILLAFLDAVPASRSVQIRTPMFKDEIFPGGALGSAEAFTGSARARTGHHNDCFLASVDDMRARIRQSQPARSRQTSKVRCDALS